MTDIKDLIGSNSPLTRSPIKPLNPYEIGNEPRAIKQKQSEVMQKYGSYMRKDIYHQWKAQTLKEQQEEPRRRDYQIIQEALLLYIKHKNG